MGCTAMPRELPYPERFGRLPIGAVFVAGIDTRYRKVSHDKAEWVDKPGCERGFSVEEFVLVVKS